MSQHARPRRRSALGLVVILALTSLTLTAWREWRQAAQIKMRRATFRFIKQRHGMEGLRRYWQDIGREYYKPVSERWREKGMAGVVEYWRNG